MPKTRVQHIIKDQQLLSIKYTETSDVAFRTMVAKNVRRLPVVDSHGILVGVVSRRDIRAKANIPVLSSNILSSLGDNVKEMQQLRSKTIAEIMQVDVEYISADATLLEAAELLYSSGHSGLPVVIEADDDDDEHVIPVGVVTRTDILKEFIAREKRRTEKKKRAAEKAADDSGDSARESTTESATESEAVAE